MRFGAATFLLSLALTFGAGCSVPVLEPDVCNEARRSLREFYSFHFGGEMPFSAEGLEERRRFLSRSFADSLQNAEESTDPFTTGTRDIPRAFRIGRCFSDSPEHTRFEMLLFWRDDERTEQRKLAVDLKLEDGNWVVDKVEH